MAASWVLEVFKSNLVQYGIHYEQQASVQTGEVLVKIENLAMTANTMTYAAMGDLGYWSLFPASSEEQGRIPAWGHGRVIASGVEDVAVDGRLFGLWPMASHVRLGGRRSRLGLRETSPWRGDLNPVYNQYALEPLTTVEARELRAVFHPLFITSFVLAQHLLEQSDVLRRIVIVSASSKTALGAAFLLKGTCELVGVTSRRNADWVRGSGIYGAVCAYDELERLGTGRCLVIDFSGDQLLLDRILSVLGSRDAELLRVGWTHGGPLAGSGVVETGEGSVFSGPKMIQHYAAKWGPAEFDRRLDSALETFTAAMQSRFTVEHRGGAEGMVGAYRDIQQGSIDASTLLIARPAHRQMPAGRLGRP